VREPAGGWGLSHARLSKRIGGAPRPLDAILPCERIGYGKPRFLLGATLMGSEPRAHDLRASSLPRLHAGLGILASPSTNQRRIVISRCWRTSRCGGLVVLWISEEPGRGLRPTHPRLFVERTGCGPPSPPARDPSEPGSEVNPVLQELYIALSVAKSLQR
jgi:hypothetical protein